MHPSDGNTYAINKHLEEIEAHAVDTWEWYCGGCDVFREVLHTEDTCPECDEPLFDTKDNWATSQETPLATQ